MRSAVCETRRLLPLYRWFPTPLCFWAVSTLLTKAFIAASCRCVVPWVVRHRWLVVDPRVSLAALRESLQNGQRSSLTENYLLLFFFFLYTSLLSSFSLSKKLSIMHAGCSSHDLELCELVFLLDDSSAKCGIPSFIAVMRLLLLLLLLLLLQQLLWLCGAPSAECCVELFILHLSLSSSSVVGSRVSLDIVWIICTVCALWHLLETL